VELAIRTAMTRLGAVLLQQLLAADTGHCGPRIDCGGGCKAVIGHTPQTVRHALEHPRRNRHPHPSHIAVRSCDVRIHVSPQQLVVVATVGRPTALDTDSCAGPI
jgi:hypothetical protein